MPKKNKNIVEGDIKAGRDVHIGDKEININYITTHKTYPKNLSQNIPLLAESKIIGRKKDLADLHQRLFSHKQVVLVNGLGGIGKTTLAQVYADKHSEEYQHLLWVSQLSGNFINDLVDTKGLMSRLGIDTTGKDLHQLYEEILAQLATIPTGPCLMIIDNADAKLSQHYNALPKQPNWHILVTSREKIERFDRKKIGFLSEEEAIALFKKHYTRTTIPDVEIKELVRTVDLHTLTIEILAKTAQKQRTSIQELKTAIEADLKAKVFIEHKGEEIERVTSYLNSIFQLTELNEQEEWLMKQFVCLPPDFHTYDILKELIAYPKKKKRFWIFFRKKEVSASFDLSERLEELVAKGWLLEENESYKMHRIIQVVATTQLSIELDAVLPLVNSIAIKLDLDQTKDNPVDKFPWVPFGLVILAQFEEEEIVGLQYNLASRLQDMGYYKEAKLLMEKGILYAEKNFGLSHCTTAAYYSSLGLILRGLGDYRGAKSLLTRALFSNEKNFGASHPSTAGNYSNLALVLKDMGDYYGAKELFEKAILFDEENFGLDDTYTSRNYSNLAMVLENMGDYQGAKKLLERAILSDEKNYGLNHPSTAIKYSNMALVLKDLGDHRGAKLLMEKAILSDEENFGLTHPSTAIKYSNLGLIHMGLKEFGEAVAMFEKSYILLKNHFGEGHPSPKRSKANLDYVLNLINNQQ